MGLNNQVGMASHNVDHDKPVDTLLIGVFILKYIPCNVRTILFSALLIQFRKKNSLHPNALKRQEITEFFFIIHTSWYFFHATDFFYAVKKTCQK